MKATLSLFFLGFLTVGLISSCKKKDPDPVPVWGCTDPSSINYNPDATDDNGSCQYAKHYLPLKAGNYWHMTDEVNVVVVTLKIYADFVQTKDTTINGKAYVIQHEVIGDSTYGVFSDTWYAYRTENSGKVFRMEIGVDSVEGLFMDYPLELGHIWYDTPDQTGIKNTVVSNSIMTVPTGSYNDVLGIEAMDLASSVPTTIYFAKDIGLIRADVTQEVQGFQINIQAELVDYHVQ